MIPVRRHLERVALAGPALQRFAERLALGLGQFGTGEGINTGRVFSAVDVAMRSGGTSWCDRCRVPTLHSTLNPDDNVRSLFQACLNDPVVQGAVGTPPDPSLRLDAASCQPCPEGTTSNENGGCIPCNGTVHGNSCDVCAPDVVLDGTTMAVPSSQLFDTSISAPGDLCPDLFWVEVRSPEALFPRGATSLGASIQMLPWDKIRCERRHDLRRTHETPGGFVTDEVLAGPGTWTSCPPGSTFCFEVCNGVPAFNLGLSARYRGRRSASALRLILMTA